MVVFQPFSGFTKSLTLILFIPFLPSSSTKKNHHLPSLSLVPQHRHYPLSTVHCPLSLAPHHRHYSTSHNTPIATTAPFGSTQLRQFSGQVPVALKRLKSKTLFLFGWGQFLYRKYNAKALSLYSKKQKIKSTTQCNKKNNDYQTP